MNSSTPPKNPEATRGNPLFKLRRLDGFYRFNVPPLLLIAISLVVFCWPSEVAGLSFLVAYPALCLIVLCASTARPSRLDRLYIFLGLISYPVYLVHWQTLYIFTWLSNRIHGFGDVYAVAAWVHFAVIPFIAFAFAHFYETPLRLFLTRHLVRPSHREARKAAIA